MKDKESREFAVNHTATLYGSAPKLKMNRE